MLNIGGFVIMRRKRTPGTGGGIKETETQMDILSGKVWVGIRAQLASVRQKCPYNTIMQSKKMAMRLLMLPVVWWDGADQGYE